MNWYRVRVYDEQTNRATTLFEFGDNVNEVTDSLEEEGWMVESIDCVGMVGDLLTWDVDKGKWVLCKLEGKDEQTVSNPAE